MKIKNKLNNIKLLWNEVFLKFKKEIIFLNKPNNYIFTSIFNYYMAYLYLNINSFNEKNEFINANKNLKIYNELIKSKFNLEFWNFFIFYSFFYLNVNDLDNFKLFYNILEDKIKLNIGYDLNDNILLYSYLLYLDKLKYCINKKLIFNNLLVLFYILKVRYYIILSKDENTIFNLINYIKKLKKDIPYNSNVTELIDILSFDWKKINLNNNNTNKKLENLNKLIKFKNKLEISTNKKTKKFNFSKKKLKRQNSFNIFKKNQGIFLIAENNQNLKLFKSKIDSYNSKYKCKNDKNAIYSNNEVKDKVNVDFNWNLFKLKDTNLKNIDMSKVKLDFKNKQKKIKKNHDIQKEIKNYERKIWYKKNLKKKNKINFNDWYKYKMFNDKEFKENTKITGHYEKMLLKRPKSNYILYNRNIVKEDTMTSNNKSQYLNINNIDKKHIDTCEIDLSEQNRILTLQSSFLKSKKKLVIFDINILGNYLKSMRDKLKIIKSDSNKSEMSLNENKTFEFIFNLEKITKKLVITGFEKIKNFLKIIVNNIEKAENHQNIYNNFSKFFNQRKHVSLRQFTLDINNNSYDNIKKEISFMKNLVLKLNDNFGKSNYVILRIVLKNYLLADKNNYKFELKKFDTTFHLNLNINLKNNLFKIIKSRIAKKNSVINILHELINFNKIDNNNFTKYYLNNTDLKDFKNFNLNILNELVTNYLIFENKKYSSKIYTYNEFKAIYNFNFLSLFKKIEKIKKIKKNKLPKWKKNYFYELKCNFMDYIFKKEIKFNNNNNKLFLYLNDKKIAINEEYNVVENKKQNEHFEIFNKDLQLIKIFNNNLIFKIPNKIFNFVFKFKNIYLIAKLSINIKTKIHNNKINKVDKLENLLSLYNINLIFYNKILNINIQPKFEQWEIDNFDGNLKRFLMRITIYNFILNNNEILRLRNFISNKLDSIYYIINYKSKINNLPREKKSFKRAKTRKTKTKKINYFTNKLNLIIYKKIIYNNNALFIKITNKKTYLILELNFLSNKYIINIKETNNIKNFWIGLLSKNNRLFNTIIKYNMNFAQTIVGDKLINKNVKRDLYYKLSKNTLKYMILNQKEKIYLIDNLENKWFILAHINMIGRTYVNIFRYKFIEYDLDYYLFEIHCRNSKVKLYQFIIDVKYFNKLWNIKDFNKILIIKKFNLFLSYLTKVDNITYSNIILSVGDNKYNSKINKKNKNEKVYIFREIVYKCIIKFNNKYHVVTIIKETLNKRFNILFYCPLSRRKYNCLIYEDDINHIDLNNFNILKKKNYFNIKNKNYKSFGSFLNIFNENNTEIENLKFTTIKEDLFNLNHKYYQILVWENIIKNFKIINKNDCNLIKFGKLSFLLKEYIISKMVKIDKIKYWININFYINWINKDILTVFKNINNLKNVLIFLEIKNMNDKVFFNNKFYINKELLDDLKINYQLDYNLYEIWCIGKKILNNIFSMLEKNKKQVVNSKTFSYFELINLNLFKVKFKDIKFLNHVNKKIWNKNSLYPIIIYNKIFIKNPLYIIKISIISDSQISILLYNKLTKVNKNLKYKISKLKLIIPYIEIMIQKTLYKDISKRIWKHLNNYWLIKIINVDYRNDNSK